MKDKKKSIIAIVAIIAVVAIAASYAYFAVSTTHSNSIGTISATMDCMNVTFTNSGTGRLTGLTYQYPVTDGYAVSHVDPVVINVTNNCTTAIDGTYYTLALTTLNNRVSILGDANLDGSVTVDDANLMMGWLARGTTPSTINNFYNADINNDKTIDIDDINYVIGLLNSPVGLIGDVDEDGDVDNDDYSLLADYLSGQPGATIGTQGMLNADVNGNGTANAPDRVFLANYLIKQRSYNRAGDVNSSGTVDISDANYLIGVLTGSNTITTDLQKYYSDINNDGRIDYDDIKIILDRLSSPTTLKGDANLDGYLTNDDVQAIQAHVNSTSPLTGQALTNADVDGSGGVTAADATALTKIIERTNASGGYYVTNFESEIPAEKIRIKTTKKIGTGQEAQLGQTGYFNEKLDRRTTGEVYSQINTELTGNNATSGYTNKNIYVVDTGKIAVNTTITYKIYTWIDYYEGDYFMYKGGTPTHMESFNNSTMNQKWKTFVSIVINAETAS